MCDRKKKVPLSQQFIEFSFRTRSDHTGSILSDLKRRIYLGYEDKNENISFHSKSKTPFLHLQGQSLSVHKVSALTQTIFPNEDRVYNLMNTLRKQKTRNEIKKDRNVSPKESLYNSFCNSSIGYNNTGYYENPRKKLGVEVKDLIKYLQMI